MERLHAAGISDGPAPSGADGPLGIVCGAGVLPFTVADAAIRQGRRVMLIALTGWADAEKVAAYPNEWSSIGQFGRMCRIARDAGCRDLVFIGSLVRPALSSLRFDFGTIRILPRLIAAYRGGDDHLLSGVARIVEAEGFRVLGAQQVAPEILMPEGLLGAVRPSDGDRRDMERGLALLRATGTFDIGQAVVVARNQVLAIEAVEGTDQMLDRVAELRQTGRLAPGQGTGVLVKAPKTGQDRRFDLPSVGPRTIEGAARAGLAGIAVIAGETIVAEPDACARAADRQGLFVIGMRDMTPS